MRRLGDAWTRFWFREVDGTPLGWVRIGVSLAALSLWAGTLPLLGRYYSDAGEFPIAAARWWSSDYLPSYLLPDFLGGTGAAATVFGLHFVVLGCLLIGYRTRTAAWANWLLVMWVQARNPTFLNGGDDVLRLASLYLALAYLAVPARERALSLDRRRALEVAGARDPAQPTRVPAWTLRLVQLQLVLIYFVSGAWKLLGSAWWSGDAVYYAVDNTSFTRFGAPDAGWLRPFSVVATWIVLWWEVLFPALVVWKRSRYAALALGVLIHGLILLLMNVGVFSLIMVALYPAFLEGSTLRRWQERLRPGRWSESGATPAPSPAGGD